MVSTVRGGAIVTETFLVCPCVLLSRRMSHVGHLDGLELSERVLILSVGLLLLLTILGAWHWGSIDLLELGPTTFTLVAAPVL